MSYPAFISAVFILLLSPGPTNTLMGLASARNSFWLVPKLLPAELLGYLTMIVPLTWLGGALISRWPETALMLKAAAAIWVMYLATKLWVAENKDITDRSVTAGRIYVTTTLNPKALVFGLVLLPSPTAPDFLPKLGIFVALASIVAVIWGLIGSLTQVGARTQRRLMILQRAASIWLAIVSCTVAAGLLQA
ncbi:LysE family translocator [Rhizobium mongolense]|uniref:LysE family translocator n=1 Tax=Rhizobium mongolense TaxID=57676 RepID=UPI003556E50F